MYIPKGLIETLHLKSNDIIDIDFITTLPADCEKCLIKINYEDINYSLNYNLETELKLNLLHQLRVVYKNAHLPFWIRGQKAFSFFIQDFLPQTDFALLSEGSEVHLDNETYYLNNDASSQSSPVHSVKAINGIYGNFKSALSNWFGRDTSEVDSPMHGSLSQSFNSKDFIYFDTLKSSLPKLCLNITSTHSSLNSMLNTIFVNPEHLSNYDSSLVSENRPSLVRLSRLLSPLENKSSRKSKDDSKLSGNVKSDGDNCSFNCISKNEENIFLTTHVLVKGWPSCSLDSVQVCDALRMQMDLSFNSKIILEKPKLEVADGGKHKVFLNDDLYISPIEVNASVSEQVIKSELKKYLIQYDILLVCRGSYLLISGSPFVVTGNEEVVIFPITLSNIDSLNIHIVNPSMRVPMSWNKCLPLRTLPEVANQADQFGIHSPYPFFLWMNELFNQCLMFIKISLDLTPSISNSQIIPTQFNRNTLLLCGSRKSGRTSLLKHLTKTLKNESCQVFISVIKCKMLKGRLFTRIKEEWTAVIKQAFYHQPSIVIFDDLDYLIPDSSQLEEYSAQERAYFTKLALFFAFFIRIFQAAHFKTKLAIIATSQSENSLNALLRQARGWNIFFETLYLNPPDKKMRKLILNDLLNHHLSNQVCPITLEELNLDDIAFKTEGYIISDLIDLIEAAIHSCLSLNMSSSFKNQTFSQDHLNTALRKLKPSILKGIKLQEKLPVSFANVGGLSKVKTSLRDKLLRAIKYPILLAKSPIRPPKNILLYGAPGTGKTLIAHALSNECHVNFITIRGPELLSKYIGKSEASIREIFKKAEKAKPCIIFFDEFDALAPRRGQDTTGVTDRVVNQLLTQMDGVEAVEQGVFVIAATSRPDLLDPALLRPGRFDQCLYCPIPDESERFEILSVLSKKLNLANNVDLNMIAQKTKNFTGADLRALLIDSQYEVIASQRYSLNSMAQSSSQADAVDSIRTFNLVKDIVVSQENILSALTKSRVSVNAKLRSEYQAA